jgi:hypothetical protein
MQQIMKLARAVLLFPYFLFTDDRSHQKTFPSDKNGKLLMRGRAKGILIGAN